MMTIQKEQIGSQLTVTISGRIDTSTAPQLETALSGSLPEITALVLDFSAVEYISSAGLRVLLTLQKTMNRQGHMELRGVNEIVMEILEISGFTGILTIR